ncbi:hypothetical protein DFH09DRAFT_1306629 [Mycena vulgaris]|nr:hypothetical protein DFH09DRAFT_1306629 [Mycena vulgaris]
MTSSTRKFRDWAIPEIPRRALPAILSLPNELLVAIATAGQEDPVAAADCKLEWNMSHVSRRFRAAIVGASTLWTLVEARLIFRGSVEIFKLYLERSLALKIDADLYECSWVGVERHLIAERLSHIIPHAHRIRRLSIIATTKSMAAILATFRHVTVPALEDLEIILQDAWYESAVFPVGMFSSGSPVALKFLKLVGFTPQFPVPQWTRSLTHLELKGRSMDDAAHGSADFFDTPALTNLTICSAHGYQICALFNPQSITLSSFPALKSLSFVNTGGCACEKRRSVRSTPSPSPPLRLFPALTSVTLINQCFMGHIVNDLLDPASQPCPLLETLTLCPPDKHIHSLNKVYNVLQHAVRAKQLTLPKLRLSSVLFSQDNWAEHGVDVELFDPAETERAFLIGTGAAPMRSRSDP